MKFNPKMGIIQIRAKIRVTTGSFLFLFFGEKGKKEGVGGMV